MQNKNVILLSLLLSCLAKQEDPRRALSHHVTKTVAHVHYVPFQIETDVAITPSMLLRCSDISHWVKNLDRVIKTCRTAPLGGRLDYYNLRLAVTTDEHTFLLVDKYGIVLDRGRTRCLSRSALEGVRVVLSAAIEASRYKRSLKRRL